MKIKLLKIRKISWKLTIVYAAMFSLMLICLNAGILFGIKYFLIHEAYIQVQESYKNTEKIIFNSAHKKTTLNNPEILNEAIANSEINIKIADSNGNIIRQTKNFNTDKISISSHLENEFQIETYENHLVIKNTKIISNGKTVGYLQIARSMNKEYNFLKLLFILMAIADSIGIILSVLTGYIISRNMLKPINLITNTAKEISIGDLNQRIEVKDTDDELARLSITFNEMIERLKVSFDRQTSFVSDASHELRTPISVIQGYINLIDRWGKHDAKVLQESIDAIKGETVEMSGLVERLLILARFDSGGLILEKEDINISEMIEEIAKESRLISSKHELKCLVDDNLVLFADKRLIKQSLRAVIDNSIKYTPENGQIIISAQKVQNQIKIVVSDTGIGISKDEINRIFERFYRVDKSRTKELGGSGLGLSIVKSIVDAHGGSVFAESEHGKGTRIIINLPL